MVKEATRITNKSATLIYHIIMNDYTGNELLRNLPANCDYHLCSLTYYQLLEGS